MKAKFCNDKDTKNSDDTNFEANSDLIACFVKGKDPNAARNAQCMCDKLNESLDTSNRFSCESGSVCSGLKGCKGSCMCTLADSCKTYICPGNSGCDTGKLRNDWDQMMLHETLHCCGVQHTKIPDIDSIEDCIRVKFGWLTRPIWGGLGKPGDNKKGDNRDGEGQCPR